MQLTGHTAVRRYYCSPAAVCCDPLRQPTHVQGLSISELSWEGTEPPTPWLPPQWWAGVAAPPGGALGTGTSVTPACAAAARHSTTAAAVQRMLFRALGVGVSASGRGAEG